jgi:entericidin B
MKLANKLLLVAALGGMLATLGACNTVKGVGRDIESVGKAGERAL